MGDSADRNRDTIVEDWATRTAGGFNEFHAARSRHLARMAADSEVFRLTEIWNASPEALPSDET